jgi:hypothetical protein
MVYDEKGEMIDDASKALLDEIECFLKFRQQWRNEDDNYGGMVAREADRRLRDVRIKPRPFMLWVDSFDPHEPWDPPSRSGPRSRVPTIPRGRATRCGSPPETGWEKRDIITSDDDLANCDADVHDIRDDAAFAACPAPRQR